MSSVTPRLEGVFLGIALSVLGYLSVQSYIKHNKRNVTYENEADDNFLSLFYGEEKELGSSLNL